MQKNHFYSNKVGQYRNKKKIIEFLTDWYQETIKMESWNLMDHFHLDQIVRSFKRPEVWFDAAFDIFKMYSDIIDRSKYTIMLCIPLLESKTKIDVALLNKDYIRRKINDFEPPSFYLAPVNYYNLVQTLNCATPINIFDSDYFKFYCSERQDGIDGLYYCSVFVVYNSSFPPSQLVEN